MLRRPPKNKPPVDLDEAAVAFVSGAERSSHSDVQPSVSGADTPKPWEEPHVRADVMKGYALRLPEPLYLQLKWTAKQTGRSINQLCRDAIEAELTKHDPDVRAPSR